MRGLALFLTALWLTTVAAEQAGPVAEQRLRLADPAVLEALRETDTPGLPRNLAPEERPFLRLPDLSRVTRIAPVADHLFTASEFERNAAILMRWGNFNAVLTEMIVPITTGDSLAKVMLVVANSSQQASAANTLNSAGANLDRVEFVIAPSNSVWIRDYGPRFTSADNDRVIIDHEYNRPRPLDNQIPSVIANHLGEDLFDMPINHGGGNFHLFANGEGFMTDLIVDENPGYTAQDVIDLYRDFQGLDLTLLPALPASFDSTQHLDMWFLPVDDRTVIIGDYSNPPSGMNPSTDTTMAIQVTEITAALMEARGYQVLRTPGWRAQGFNMPHITYTNAVIVNNLVLMCRFNGFENQNAQARTVFEQAFPDFSIVPVDCSTIINSAGALHCIVKHKPAPGFRLALDQASASACTPNEGSQEISVDLILKGFNNYDGPVSLQAGGEPNGVSSQFSPATLAPSEAASWTVTISAEAGPGTHEITLFGEDAIGPGLPAVFTLNLESRLSGPDMVHPPAQAEDVDLQPILQWDDHSGADGYRVQLAGDPKFSALQLDELVDQPAVAVEQALASGQVFYWRVLANNNCGEGAWSEIRAFQTRFEPRAQVTPEQFAFDIEPDGETSDQLLIANAGNGELDWSLTTENCAGTEASSWLSIDQTSGVATIEQSSTVVVSVDALGLSPGASYHGGLCLTSNEFDAEPFDIPVSLTVSERLPGELALAPSALAFGDVSLGNSERLELVLSNVAAASAADLSLDQVRIIAGQSVFTLAPSGQECGSMLPAQSECVIGVRFTPNVAGTFPGVLRFRVDDQNVNVTLSGRGVKLPPELFRDRFEAKPKP